ncbi:MAG: hypothetical protein ACRCYU_10720 [Nocardioides sp.]
MLARALATIAAAAIALLGAAAPPTSGAAPGENCWAEPDPATGELKLVCESGGGSPGGGGGTGGSSTCQYGGREIPCTGPAGSVWNGTCYVGEPTRRGIDGPNGEKSPEEGQWHTCYLPPGISGPNIVWVGAGETLIDPVTLAYRAVAAMDLDPITVGIVPEQGPDRVGLVGLPVWMWVENQTPDTWGPITRSASQGPVSVTATATVDSVTWDMKDGTKVTCTGPGTPYTDSYGKKDSPTCGHRYEKMSTDQPDRAYQITATSHWIVEWTGAGQTGTIEFDLTTNPVPVRIAEAQVLTQ